MNLDAHQHFWRYSPAEYPWIPPSSPIHHDFLPHQLLPLLQAAHLDGSIAVQARQSLDENSFLLQLADQYPSIRGVVGWVDLASPNVHRQLADFHRHPCAVGIRHVAQDEPDDHFLARPHIVRGIARLQDFGLTYDILIYPRQLPAALELVRQLPQQPFVLDHLAKPLIRQRALDPWRSQLRQLAQAPNCFCKLSGLVTEAPTGPWQPADFYPCLDAAWEAFGEDRLMFGSDWPVCLLNGDYPSVRSLIHDYVQSKKPAALPKVFGQNAQRFYRIPSPPPPPQ